MAGPYTEALIQTLLKIASGDQVLSATATAALEICAGYWGRAFALADCKPDLVSPEVMSTIGRQLLLDGETLWYVSVEGGTLELLPIAAYAITGKASWKDWRYLIQIDSPSNTQRQFSVTSAEVVHVRYSINKIQPWVGVSPLTNAADTAIALGNVEARLKEEAGTPTGYLLPVPQRPTNETDEQGNLIDPLAPLQNFIQSLKGKLGIVETMSGGWGEGRANSPNNEYQAQRIGAHPPDTLLKLRWDVQHTILAACGVPPQFATGDGDASQGNREAWRQFLHGTIAPVGRLVQFELRRKLNTPGLQLEFDNLFASDLQGRARAFQSMVQGRIHPQDAARLCGWEDVRIEEPIQPQNGEGEEPM